MTEIAGEFGSGKSQLCYTLCMTGNMSEKKGGLGGNIIFIDTENTFRPERIHQIAENRGIGAPEEIQRARFGFLPMSLAARHGINRLIESENDKPSPKKT